MIPIPITKGVYRSQNDASTRNTEYAQILYNMFLDSAGANYDRPTLELLTTLDSVDTIGITYFDGVFVVVTSDRKVYTVEQDGTMLDVTGDLLDGFLRPTFVDNGTSLIICGGATPLRWDGVGTQTETLGGSPPDGTHIVYLDGFLILNNTGTKIVRFADLDDVEGWDVNNFFTCNAHPDILQGLAVSQRELWAIGEKSTEVWQNLGGFPVPFERAFVFNYGTIAPYSILSVDNSVFFMDQDRRIRQFSGREQVRLSEPIEEDLSKYEFVSDCISQWFAYNGSIHIVFIFPTEKKCWSIDLKNGQWTQWTGYNNGYVRPRINCLFYHEGTQQTLIGDFSTNRIWQFSSTNKTDAGGIFLRQRTFCERDSGTSIKKQANLLRLHMRRDVANDYEGQDPDTNPTVEIRWKDDDKGWSQYRRVPLGNIGNKKNYVEIRRLGIYRSRTYDIRMTDPAELNITSIETDEEPLTT